MKEIIINGGEIRSKEELHDTFSEQCGFPDWYGRNLDALHDCLTDIREPLLIRIENYGDLEKNLPVYARLLVRVLRHSCADNAYLSFTADRDCPDDDDEEEE